MKSDLALRLLQGTISAGGLDEGAISSLFRQLQVLSDYKYNRYEMYHPGRLFLENLYVWLEQFNSEDRLTALEFIRKHLIYVSREEFQQLAGVLYDDHIRQEQFSLAATKSSIPRHRVREIRESGSFGRLARSSLYVGMSDGARLDFIRRHNLDISNEQVIPYYAVDEEKVTDCLQSLQATLKDPGARFDCLFLIDDFAGSGSTLLREVMTVPVNNPDWRPPELPADWHARMRFRGSPAAIELVYRGPLTLEEVEELRSLDSSPAYQDALAGLVAKAEKRETVLKGSLTKVSTGKIKDALSPDASVFFCPLLTTSHALTRLTPLISRLESPFSSARILAGGIIEDDVAVRDTASEIGKLCQRYYRETMGDEHTGPVMFGYDECGLPLVLHHNTPNNSLYVLWMRHDFQPLFVRYERHGRENF